MSVAIRKRSWEEHVTQQSGQPLRSDDYNTACHHGLVADSLQESMEKDVSLNVDCKEQCASLPDCCHGSEWRAFSGRPIGHVSKEVDENDSPEGEDQFLSLEASTETLVHISDEDTNSELYFMSDKQSLTTKEHEIISQDNIEGAGSIGNTLPIMESNQDSYNSWGEARESDLALTDESEERKNVDTVSKSLELCNNISINEIKDVPKDSSHVKANVPEKHLLNSAVIAQQRRKLDFPKDDHERNNCHEVQDESLAGPCTGNGLSLLKAGCGSYLLQPPSCPSGSSAENGLQKSGFSEHQNTSIPEVCTEDGMPCLHLQNSLATQEPTGSQVRLRKKKEIREDRDKTRLDSMVLLIMKLDQLDQDIENALSTSPSPSGTPTNRRRHVPDLESGSESGADTSSLNQIQVNLPPNTQSTDTSSSTPTSSSGTKPKATLHSDPSAEITSLELFVKEASHSAASAINDAVLPKEGQTIGYHSTSLSSLNTQIKTKVKQTRKRMAARDF
ncbi:rho GTPase-activating protein 7-like [Thomomys bottae]